MDTRLSEDKSGSGFPDLALRSGAGCPRISSPEGLSHIEENCGNELLQPLADKRR